MTIGTVGGVPLRLHWSFILVVVVWLGWTALTQGIVALPTHVGGIVALFGSVLLHELGHAAMAHRLGIRTHEITLLPVGGAARMELRFVKPYADLLVSLAGPVASVAIGSTLYILGMATGMVGLLVLGAINMFIGLFNLLPAFPMDGGRVLRAWLTEIVGSERANDLALGIGAVFAVAFVVVGVVVSQPAFSVLGVLLAAMQVHERRVVRLLRERSIET